jgi:hydroxyacylglutathione hydrolase
MTFCSTRLFGLLFLKAGLIKRRYTAFKPDLLLKNGERPSLERYGFSGEVAHTPGHIEGSISVKLGDGQARMGDLLSSGILLCGIALKGRAKRQPFEDDATAVAKVQGQLLDQGAQHFYMGHGGPLPAEEVARRVARLRK